jgi:hypothetical protein
MMMRSYPFSGIFGNLDCDKSGKLEPGCLDFVMACNAKLDRVQSRVQCLCTHFCDLSDLEVQLIANRRMDIM